MKWLCIIGMIFFILPFTLAEDIALTYPEEVSVGEEFVLSVTLIDFSSQPYDIKIDILSEGTRVARILNDGTYKSTYYYIAQGITDSGDFHLIIPEYTGSADIIVKIRDAKKHTSVFEGYDIISVSQTGSTQEKSFEELSSTEETEQPKEAPSLPKTQNTPVEKPQPKTTSQNQKDIKKSETEDNSQKKYAQIGFFVFCLILLGLFFFKQKNNESK